MPGRSPGRAFVLLGLFMEPLSAMPIMIPIVVPTLTKVDGDPIQIGVLMIFNLMTGLLTPRSLPAISPTLTTGRRFEISLRTTWRL
jgi:hypothetical protein